MVPTLLFLYNAYWRGQGGKKHTIIMKHQFSYVLSFVLMLFVSACNQDSGRDKVTHIPYKADKDSRWGLIDWEGNPLIEDEFTEKPSAVTENRFYVKNSDGLYEFYTAEKKFKKIGKEYVQAGAFHDGLAPVVEKDQPISFIRPDGAVAFTFDVYKNETIRRVSIFQEGRALFLTDSGKYGYIDVNGKVVIEPVYDKASLFCNNSARVYKAQNEKHGETFLIDKDGKEYFKVNPDHQIESLLSQYKIVYSEKIDKKKAYDILNEQGEVIQKASKKYSGIEPFYKNYAVFENQSGEYGLMDKDGNTVIRAKYTRLVALDDVLIYKEKDKYGLVSYSGDKICDAIYDDILSFQPGNKYTYALDNQTWILIDKKGKDMHKDDFSKISYNEYPYFFMSMAEISLSPYAFDDFSVESDYIDVQAEVDRAMNLINEDGSVDKLIYGTKPMMFANIYDEDYKASELQGHKYMEHSLKNVGFIRSAVTAMYNTNVIVPKYERKWKESYRGRGYWENEIVGYSYNDDARITMMGLSLVPMGKLVDRKQEMFDAACHWMETRGYTKLSTDNNNEGEIFVSWEKKTAFIIKAGVYLTKDYVAIIIRKE